MNFTLEFYSKSKVCVKITFKNKTEDFLKTEINCVYLLTKVVDNPHFLDSLHVFSHEAQIPHFSAVHSKSLSLVATNGESKTAFIFIT